MLRRYVMLIAACLAISPATRTAAGMAQDTKAAPALPVASANLTVARVSGEAITESQVLDSISQLAMRLASQGQATPEQINQKDTVFFKEALENLVGTILLKNEAKQKHLVADKDRIDENLRSLKKSLGDETKFQQALQQQGLKEDDLRRSFETDLLCRQILDQIAKTVPPATDIEIRKYYEANLKSFQAPEQRHVAAIALKVEKGASPQEKLNVWKRLENLRVEIESKKTTFAEAAIKESDDKANSARGGDIGFVRRGMMLKSLEDAVFATPPGALTPILETDIGYHLLKVIEIRPAGIMPLETVRSKIKDLLDGKAKQDATRRHLEGLKAGARIEYLMSDDEWNKRHAAK